VQDLQGGRAKHVFTASTASKQAEQGKKREKKKFKQGREEECEIRHKSTVQGSFFTPLIKVNQKSLFFV
jgi:hypothetical protein